MRNDNFMFPLEKLINFIGSLISLKDLEWILSDLESSGFKEALISFVTNSQILPYVNVIFSYLGEVELIEWVRVEITISKDIEALSFFTKYYPALIKSGGEVIVKSDGISVFYKVKLTDETRKLVDYVAKVAELIGTEVSVLRYSGYTLVSSGNEQLTQSTS
ncbi:MAG: hypothetical protein QN229_07205 [Desulfurococcaceae archaeon TW002]